VIAAVNLGVHPGCAIGEIKREQMKILGLGQFSDSADLSPALPPEPVNASTSRFRFRSNEERRRHDQ